ncbi:MAG TPA: glycoside hydrolase family 3 N-terminal domain-containing protein, partial [Gemmatimonadales bacterium]|nr:glycoside hydrolase family 3 N-terminal domain-containing protein [Gemmatimonadales bacterium]
PPEPVARVFWAISRQAEAPRARLVCPSIRWRRGSFASEQAKIRDALATGVGGFILFGGTRAAVASLTQEIRTRARRPLLLGSDLERGAGQQIRGLTELPPPGALGFINDLDATARCGAITALEAKSVGINWVFAPVCDLDIEPRNPIVQTRSFGAEPARVGAHAAAWISACQNEGLLACAKHYPGHGRTTTDSHEGVPVVDAAAAEVQQTDVEPFKTAVQVGVASVMPGFVSFPSWDPSGAAAGFSKPMLDYLRTTIGFSGLIVTDAFIMGGATATAPEGAAAVAAIAAGCDMLLYPTDWAAVVRALKGVEAARAEEALARYEKAIMGWGKGDAGRVTDQQLADHQKFADGLADRALHLVRGEPEPLGKSVSVTIVDDDVGGPYSIPPRDVFVRELVGRGIGVSREPEPGTRHIVLVYAEPRSWKGRGDLGAKTIAQLERLMPQASLVVLFAHPRLVAQVPGNVPVLCGWHGQALMQRAAARWVSAA